MREKKIEIALWVGVLMVAAIVIQNAARNEWHPPAGSGQASAQAAPRLLRDPVLMKRCDRLIKSYSRAGACGEYRVVGNEFVSVKVGTAFYGMTFDEKEVLAKAFRYRERLVDWGSVEFVDLYTGRTVAELNALGFSMK